MALFVIFLYLAVVLVVGVAARVKGRFSLAEYLVAGRALGFFLIYFLLVGDIYSGFAFLGAGGWAYKYGAPVFFIPAYAAIAYMMLYILGPKIWYFGKKHGFVTEPDFFVARYDSKFLGLLTAIIGVIFIIPYLQLQIMAGGLIFNAASYGAISQKLGMVIAFVVAGIYVYTSGLRGIAWTNVIQAVVMIVAALAGVFYIIPKLFGGLGPMFQELAQKSPQHLTLPGAKGTMGYSWFFSVTVLSGLGFWMWPHLFQNNYAASSDKEIKRSAFIAPLYTYLIMVTATLGFGAVLKLKLSNPDLSVMEMIKLAAPAWFVGLVGAGGLAAAMSTADTLTLNPAGLIGKNIYRDLINPRAEDSKVAKITQTLTLPLLVISLLFALFAPKLLVKLLLVGYSGITQMFPGVLLGLFWRRVTKAGIIAGLLVGEVTAIWMLLAKVKTLFGISFHAGFWGLILNFAVVIVVSLLTKPPREEVLKDFELA